MQELKAKLRSIGSMEPSFLHPDALQQSGQQGPLHGITFGYAVEGQFGLRPFPSSAFLRRKEGIAEWVSSAEYAIS